MKPSTIVLWIVEVCECNLLFIKDARCLTCWFLTEGAGSSALTEGCPPPSKNWDNTQMNAPMLKKFTHCWISFIKFDFVLLAPHPGRQKRCEWGPRPLTGDVRTAALSSRETRRPDRSNPPEKTCKAADQQMTRRSPGLVFTVGASRCFSNTQ